MRLPWNWQPRGKTSEHYSPRLRGKWWFFEEEELARASSKKRADYGHMGRIMETELGEQLFGEDRCNACKSNRQECWRYSQLGAQQVSRPGDACARCRYVARAGGCSLSKLSKRKTKQRPPLTTMNHNRIILPKNGPYTSFITGSTKVT